MPPTDIQHPFQGHSDTAVISAGASLSAAIKCVGRSLKEIKMPGAWTAANLTFQYCESEGGVYLDFYDPAGTEYLVVAAASHGITLPHDAFTSKPFLKIRSGTGVVPVAQGADRTLVLIFWEME